MRYSISLFLYSCCQCFPSVKVFPEERKRSAPTDKTTKELPPEVDENLIVVPVPPQQEKDKPADILKILRLRRNNNERGHQRLHVNNCIKSVARMVGFKSNFQKKVFPAERDEEEQFGNYLSIDTLSEKEQNQSRSKFSIIVDKEFLKQLDESQTRLSGSSSRLDVERKIVTPTAESESRGKGSESLSEKNRRAKAEVDSLKSFIELAEQAKLVTEETVMDRIRKYSLMQVEHKEEDAEEEAEEKIPKDEEAEEDGEMVSKQEKDGTTFKTNLRAFSIILYIIIIISIIIECDFLMQIF